MQLIGTWFQVPFSRNCWHVTKCHGSHGIYRVKKTQLRGCLLCAAKACAEWGPRPQLVWGPLPASGASSALGEGMLRELLP